MAIDKQTAVTSYRPRNPGHDYYGRGIYLITLVVNGREPLLAQYETQTLQSVTELGHNEKIATTSLGEAVMHAWHETPSIQATHGNHVAIQACVCMPDHFHGVIEVLEPMRWSLGDIMQAFKATCTARWQAMQGLPSSTNRLISVDYQNPDCPEWLRKKALVHHNEGALVRSLSHKQRQEYYALVGRNQRPLFDDNYDDTVCLDERHRKAMIAYVCDNPRRALLRRRLPDVMQRCLHVQIGQRSYGAFGNLFLLRWARKVQVQCHRRHPVSRLPYESTDDYARQHDEWIAAIMTGQTVIVTPGISRGEQLMKAECLEKGYPLIHLQSDPIGPYWKPERSRFDACASGSLLILAPWNLDAMGDVAGIPADSNYSRFHNLNTLAEEICSFEGEARIMRD